MKKELTRKEWALLVVASCALPGLLSFGGCLAWDGFKLLGGKPIDGPVIWYGHEYDGGDPYGFYVEGVGQ